MAALTVDSSWCVDIDCPWPSHQGPCPVFATVEEERDAWKAEANRVRKFAAECRQRAWDAEDRFNECFGNPNVRGRAQVEEG